MLPLIALAQQGPIEIGEALAIGGVARSGRIPAPVDAVLDRIAAGTLGTPKVGDVVPFGDRSPAWRKVTADKDGWLGANGYVFATVDLPAAATMMLEAQGDSIVYVNGVPRAGDPYATGYVRLPVSLHAGSNSLLFVSGRGRLKARLAPVTKTLSLDTGDTTLPDAVTTDRGDLLGGMIVLNAGAAKKGLRMRTVLPDGRSRESALPSVPALSLRKVPFALPMPYTFTGTTLPLTVELLDGGQIVDTTKIELRVRQPNEIQRRTFLSDVDGSVQYYAVNPAQQPGPENVLALTLHGASVEAQGQAQAYKSKEDVSIVAATNRRPYGFDWEDIGRLDALEVLDVAKRTIPHDPNRVVLTGHSMGGHGTWSVGTLYPDRFAAIAPSAGWISFWSYAGGWEPEVGKPADAIVRRAMNPSDTLGRITNTLAQGVYILHGDADDNVPVEQARTMKAALEKIGHPDLGYHEEPGAGHWWGDQCVDYPELFATLRKRRLETNPETIDFTTPNPGVSSRAWWATVEAVTEQGLPARIKLKRNDAAVEGTTENVARLTLKRPVRTVSLDGQSVPVTASAGDVTLVRENGRWQEGKPPAYGKVPAAMGPFKAVFGHKVVFVVPTGGTGEEDYAAADQARYDAETFYVRGNGGVDIVTDAELLKGGFERRNVLLYGNADTNKAWKRLFKDSPVEVRRGRIRVGSKTVMGTDLGVLLVRRKPGIPDCLVGAMAPTGAAGAARLVRVGTFTSGVAYPDWTIVGPKGIGGAGFFGNDWALGTGVSGWNP
jgi:poly(3-hydroxybutyrate) depolymerase